MRHNLSFVDVLETVDFDAVVVSDRLAHQMRRWRETLAQANHDTLHESALTMTPMQGRVTPTHGE